MVNAADMNLARVLVVEDNATSQIVARSMLEKMSLLVDVVSNGQQAVDACKSMDYALVLMDCEMPIMDGYEASRRIRNPDSQVRNTQVPIVALSAHSGAAVIQECKAAGMNEVLEKPLKPASLDRVLQNWVDGHKECAECVEPDSAAAVKLSTVFDLDEMSERLMGNELLIRTVARGFLQDMSTGLEQITQALAEEDRELLKSTAHKLKGSCANVGAHATSVLAAQMETNALSANLDSLHDGLGELEQSCAELSTVMQKTLDLKQEN